ncbi:MAG: GGDEF domain-containing protein, partial [Eubacteriales bacterium]
MFHIIALLNVSIDFFALAVLLIIYLNMRRHTDPFLFDNNIFRLLFTTDALIIALDVSMWLMDGKTGLAVRDAYLIVSACYYILNPVICLLWYFYADFHVYRNKQHFKKFLIPMLIPCCVCAVLSVLSIFNGFFFYLDSSNTYHRGSG